MSGIRAEPTKPIKLDKAFSCGRLQRLTFKPDVELSPPKNSAWILLYGLIDHVNGAADTELVLEDIIDGEGLWDLKIAAAAASGEYPLFSTYSSLTQPNFSWIIVTANQKLGFTGNAGVGARVMVIEWEL